MNTYLYGLANPTKYTDPLGLCVCDSQQQTKPSERRVISSSERVLDDEGAHIMTDTLNHYESRHRQAAEALFGIGLASTADTAGKFLFRTAVSFAYKSATSRPEAGLRFSRDQVFTQEIFEQDGKLGVEMKVLNSDGTVRYRSTAIMTGCTQ